MKECSIQLFENIQKTTFFTCFSKKVSNCRFSWRCHIKKVFVARETHKQKKHFIYFMHMLMHSIFSCRWIDYLPLLKGYSTGAFFAFETDEWKRCWYCNCLIEKWWQFRAHKWTPTAMSWIMLFYEFNRKIINWKQNNIFFDASIFCSVKNQVGFVKMRCNRGQKNAWTSI